MVASIPIFAVVGMRPGVGGNDGSNGLDRALETISTSRSAWTRVATAHSTSVGSKTSMSSSTIVTCLISAMERSARMAFLPSPGCFLIAATICQWQHPPGVTLIAVLHAGFVKHAPGRRFVDRRAHPDIFPGHMQRVVDRIFAVH